jgi:hypothetical protein
MNAVLLKERTLNSGFIRPWLRGGHVKPRNPFCGNRFSPSRPSTLELKDEDGSLEFRSDTGKRKNLLYSL